MSNINKVRLAHELLDEVNAREDLTPEQVGVLRSFLPERPKQKTLEEIYVDVSLSLDKADGDNWEDECVYLESWLGELKAQLKGLIDESPAHPEFLDTAADYENAPESTVVASDHLVAVWIKKSGRWSSTDGCKNYAQPMARSGRRRVLRWGNK